MKHTKDHSVEYMGSKKSSQPDAKGLTHFMRQDIFYCKECQDLITKEKAVVSKERPTWY